MVAIQVPQAAFGFVADRAAHGGARGGREFDEGPRDLLHAAVYVGRVIGFDARTLGALDAAAVRRGRGGRRSFEVSRLLPDMRGNRFACGVDVVLRSARKIFPFELTVGLSVGVGVGTSGRRMAGRVVLFELAVSLAFRIGVGASSFR